MASNALTTTSATATPAQDKIQGLREQIIANASILFPQLVAISEHTAPNKVFQVITTRENSSSRALLLFGDGLAKKIAAKGPASSDGAEQALSGLLDVTSEALAWYTTTLLGELENGEEIAGGGEVNFLMVEEGFHFAAEERWAEAN